MSFPWWESKIPEDYLATFPHKLETMLVEETKRRAQILYSLGFALPEAVARVRAYLRWDYEGSGTPAAVAKLEGVVAEVYARRTGRGPEAPKTLDAPKALSAPSSGDTPKSLKPAKAPSAAKEAAAAVAPKAAVSEKSEKAAEKAAKKAGKKAGKKH